MPATSRFNLIKDTIRITLPLEKFDKTWTTDAVITGNRLTRLTRSRPPPIPFGELYGVWLGPWFSFFLFTFFFFRLWSCCVYLQFSAVFPDMVIQRLTTMTLSFSFFSFSFLILVLNRGFSPFLWTVWKCSVVRSYTCSRLNRWDDAVISPEQKTGSFSLELCPLLSLRPKSLHVGFNSDLFLVARWVTRSVTILTKPCCYNTLRIQYSKLLFHCITLLRYIVTDGTHEDAHSWITAVLYVSEFLVFLVLIHRG